MTSSLPLPEQVIVHSNMTLEESLKGTTASADILKSLTICTVEYYNFEQQLCRGQIVVHKSLADDVIALFNTIKANKFPIAKVIPIVQYGWDDDKSMADNNSSGFNYRPIAGTTKLSNHSLGRAIDLNPVQNPYVRTINGQIVIQPTGASYQENKVGTVTTSSFITTFLKSKNWAWGGEWHSLKDYQHFEKTN